MIDKREMQYLYRDGSDYVFMDNETYEQLNVTPASLGSAADYMRETDSAVLQMYGDEIVGVDLPAAGLLSVALGGVVLAFATAEPERAALSPDAEWYLTAAALAGIGFVVRNARGRHPVVPPKARSAGAPPLASAGKNLQTS